MPEPNEADHVIPVPVVGPEGSNSKAEETDMEPADYGVFKQNLFTQIDRHNRNAVTFDNMLQFQYAGTNEFRTANAARVVLESGSGRTRAETNLPASTSAAGNAP